MKDLNFLRCTKNVSQHHIFIIPFLVLFHYASEHKMDDIDGFTYVVV